ncbi:hypothetical protein ACBJ59_15425 [Nonomuraea sp. MTCD27]|uniref:hypothetical protein n=1 Tax=Nonomuraea sp. MTCD27 TaxID=1676747 RepID=UPI0035C22441
MMRTVHVLSAGVLLAALAALPATPASATPASAASASASTASATSAVASAGSASASARIGTSAAVAPFDRWGPVYSPGRQAKAIGELRATGLDPEDDLPVAHVRVRVLLADRTPSDFRCAWAVFRITYYDDEGQPALTHKRLRNCFDDETPSLLFSRSDVTEVELKVCSEAKSARPSANCLYSGTWKVLFTAFP